MTEPVMIDTAASKTIVVASCIGVEIDCVVG